MLFNRTILFAGESPYGKYKVVDTLYDGRPARVLYGSNGSPQSGAARDDNPTLLFDYNQRFLEMIMSRRPQKLLVIGGGAFMLPIAAYYRFPELVIDVVEIDELLVKLSRDYFSLPDDARLRVHIADGATFIAQSNERYDMIIIDAFSGYTIPPHLLERVTIQHYHHHLAKDGVVALNFISDFKQSRPRLAHQLLATFSEVFASVSLYQAGRIYKREEEQNRLLVAADQPIHFEYLQSIVTV